MFSSTIIIWLAAGVILCLLAASYHFRIRKTMRLNIEMLQADNNSLSNKINDLTLLRESENNELIYLKPLASVAQQSNNALMLMDADGNILWVNKGFELMYEYNLEEFIRARGDNIRKTSFSNTIIERIERCKQTRKPVVYDALNITHTGKEIWTQTLLMPIFSSTNEITHLATIDADIHERKTATNQLIEYSTNIGQKVDELSSEFDQLITITSQLFNSLTDYKNRFGDIGSSLNMINDITLQTRILGLNAVIEASSAGALGNGFRVIAGEMIKVSEKTQLSAREIHSMLSEIESSASLLSSEKSNTEQAIGVHKELMNSLRADLIHHEAIIEKLV